MSKVAKKKKKENNFYFFQLKIVTIFNNSSELEYLGR